MVICKSPAFRPFTQDSKPHGLKAQRKTSLLGLALCGLLALSVSDVQAQVFDPFYTEGPLVQVSHGSPFPRAGHGDRDHIDQQPGTNYYNTTVEPMVSINPTNPLNIVSVWQQDRWSNGGCRGIVAGVSYDAGATWYNVVLPDFTLASGAPNGYYQRTSDPWVSFAPNGDCYASGLAINGTDGRTGVEVAKSKDGGWTWSKPTLVIDNPASAGVLNDKDSITADPVTPGYAYIAWDQLNGSGQPPFFTRTTNGGKTWEAARQISPIDSINNIVVVSPKGKLFDFFTDLDNGTLALITSSDKGVTWSKNALTVSSMQPTGTSDPITGAGIRDGGGLAAVAVDAHNGYLYAVWMDARFSSGQFNNIAFSMSKNSGVTWSTPIPVNQTPVTIPAIDQQAFEPGLTVTPSGEVAVTYYDFRNSAGATTSACDFWMAFCKPGKDCTNPANWGLEQRLTAASFDINTAPNADGSFLGDYSALAALTTQFVPVFAIPDGTGAQYMYFRDISR